MCGYVIQGALAIPTLPGGLFANAESVRLLAPDREAYETAVATFEREASPAAINESIMAARRYGFKMTRGEARENAADGLRMSLTALGYGEAEIRWHVARRGRRDRSLFASSVHARLSIIRKSPQVGRWRGSYTKRARH